MADAEITQVEVFPAGDPIGSEWAYSVKPGEEASNPFPTRAEAIEAARYAAGQRIEKLYRSDGTVYGEARTPGARVVLLRPDGSEYGELDPPPSAATGPPQVIQLEPLDAEHSAEEVETDG